MFYHLKDSDKILLCHKWQLEFIQRDKQIIYIINKATP